MAVRDPVAVNDVMFTEVGIALYSVQMTVCPGATVTALIGLRLSQLPPTKAQPLGTLVSEMSYVPVGVVGRTSCRKAASHPSG